MEQSMLRKWQDAAIHNYKQGQAPGEIWMQNLLLAEIALRLENNEKMNEQEEQEQTQLKLLVIKDENMDEEVSLLKQIRESMEYQIAEFRKGSVLSHESVQTYLLLEIIDLLQGIDSSLSSMSNDSWNDHHNR